MWNSLYSYEEFEHPVTKEIYRSAVGYCSVYKFYAYPDNIRTRISQFFIIPPHQRKGIGSELYDTVIKDIKKMPEVIDITGRCHIYRVNLKSVHIFLTVVQFSM